jgi:hypothetical protein
MMAGGCKQQATRAHQGRGLAQREQRELCKQTPQQAQALLVLQTQRWWQTPPQQQRQQQQQQQQPGQQALPWVLQGITPQPSRAGKHQQQYQAIAGTAQMLQHHRCCKWRRACAGTARILRQQQLCRMPLGKAVATLLLLCCLC